MFNLVQFLQKRAASSGIQPLKEKIAPQEIKGIAPVEQLGKVPEIKKIDEPVESLTSSITDKPLKKIAYARNTGLADCDGLPYTNTYDVLLLNKLGYTIDENSYLFLPRGQEREGLYTYIEKNAGVPKIVTRAIDEGKAFSSEYLKDMDYEVPKGYEVKGDLCCPVEKTAFELNESPEKTAAADPSQTILITGHSGSGKSTLGKLLAEKLNLPLQRVDAQESWDNLRADLEGRPDYERKALTPGSIENKKYIRDIRKIVGKSLKEINGPAILEGTQVTTLPNKQLQRYLANIVVGGDVEQSVAQRLQRTIDKAAKKGIVFSPEELEKKKSESRLVADSWHPGIEKFKQLPGVLKYNHTEHQAEPLIKQLQQLMSKEASTLVVSGIHGDEPAGNMAASKSQNIYQRVRTQLDVVKELLGKKAALGDTAPSMSLSTGSLQTTHSPINIQASTLGQTTPVDNKAKNKALLAAGKDFMVNQAADTIPNIIGAGIGPLAAGMGKRISNKLVGGHLKWEGAGLLTAGELAGRNVDNPADANKTRIKSYATSLLTGQLAARSPLAAGLVLGGQTLGNIGQAADVYHKNMPSSPPSMGTVPEQKFNINLKEQPTPDFRLTQPRLREQPFSSNAIIAKQGMEKEAGKQPLLPGIREWIKKQPFNHAEYAYKHGRIPKHVRDDVVSGRAAEKYRPKFKEMLDNLRKS